MNKQIKMLERAARQNLSNFDGPRPMDRYDGPDDMLVNYTGRDLGGGNFNYKIRLVNANAATRTALLCPGLIASTTGRIAEGAFNDKNNAAGLTGSGTPKSISYFNEWVQKVPMRCLTIKLKSTDALQTEENITFQQEGFSRDLDSRIISISQYTQPSDQQDKMVIIPTADYSLQFDNQTRIELPVVGSSTVDLNFFFGPVLNTAEVLDKRVRSKFGR